MKIFRFDSLDSTSAHASRLLDQAAEQAPFAVMSRTQTQGRGRSGRSWSSPDGGLYLTLVIDGAHAFKPALLPLWVAASTAAWIHKVFHIRCTVKWPNDLLFAGRKLAGILCEGRVQGQVIGPSIIGIGINLHDAPAVAEQATTSIDAILGRVQELDALQLAESLLEFLLGNLRNHDWMQQYRNYALEEGQLWQDGSGRLAKLAGIDENGQLLLRSLADGRVEALHSASHGFRWLQQGDDSKPLLVADLGNSLGKLAAFRGNEAPAFTRVNLLHPRDEDKAELGRFIAAYELPKMWPVFAISVSDRASEQLRSQLREHGLELHAVPKRPLLVNYDAYRFQELGIDRIAMSEAAESLRPRQAKIVVSAGTCVTVEVLDAERRYLGGYILPGLQTKLNSLHLRTDRLPALKISDLDPNASIDLLGHDTRTAMLYGVLQETALTIRGLAHELNRQHPDQTWTLLCTGGDGLILSRILDAEFLPDLILRGIRLMVLGGLP